MESEYNLYIRTAEGVSASGYLLCADNGGGSHGIWKDNSHQLVLDEQGKIDALCLIRISVYSDNLAIFWKSVQVAFKRAGFDFLEDYACPEDVAGAGLG